MLYKFLLVGMIFFDIIATFNYQKWISRNSTRTQTSIREKTELFNDLCGQGQRARMAVANGNKLMGNRLNTVLNFEDTLDNSFYYSTAPRRVQITL